MADFCTVARFEELPEVGGKEVIVKGARISLFKHAGEVFAIAAECPHKGAPLAVGWVEQGSVFCALHGWEFDLRTGRCKSNPGEEVRSYPLRIIDGEIQVSVGD